MPAQTATAQSTYVVNSSGDADDDNPGDGNCETSGGDCTLRAAIQEANETSDNDDIEFDIPETGIATITLNSKLPIIDETVSVDGTTSPEYPSSVGGPIIEIDASGLSDGDDGLRIGASDVTISALAVNSAPDDGILVFSTTTGVTVEDCFVGVAPNDGASDRGNGDFGVVVGGGEVFISGNVISQNEGGGVFIDGSDGTMGDNYIGLDHNGDTKAGNAGVGIMIDGGSNNSIGYISTEDLSFTPHPNYIGGNAAAGVRVESSGNTISSNRIGTDAGGTTTTGTLGNDLGNGSSGIFVLADDTHIGGNTVSGNSGDGIEIGASGSTADNNTISNNNVGVDYSADVTLPNSAQGISVRDGSGTTIDGNVIGGNGYRGITIFTINSNVDEKTAITGNHIGTNSKGDDLGNDGSGVRISADPTSVAREVEIFGENVIGHNGNQGVSIDGDEHDVANNFIGTNANGDDLGNTGNGVVVWGDDVAVGRIAVGGSTEGGNTIGHNGFRGINLNGATNAVVRQNYVGTNANDDDLGNGTAGIEIQESSGDGAANNEIGHDATESFSDPHPADGGDGNVVAYNSDQGIIVEGDPSTGNSVRGNVVYQNGSIGLDLGDDGVTPNDDADFDDDTGPNNLQNFPVIEDVLYDESIDEVSITYNVQTATDYADYPLTIDFYAADSETSGEGKIFLDTQEYSESQATSSVTNVIDLGQFSNVTKDDHFVAAATDASGNTSEFLSTPEQLPVELAAFEGTQTGEDAVELSWTTASEQNNAGFEVQRRDATEAEADEVTAEGDWEKVGYVESKADGGTTNEAITYRFATEDLEVGTHAFRLKQVDLDGTENLHDPTVVELRMKEALRLDAPAPNPVRGQTTLSFAVKEQAETTISLYNTLGQKVSTVYRGTPSAGEQQTVDLSATDLSSGVYFLRLEAGGQTRTERMTVVR